MLFNIETKCFFVSLFNTVTKATILCILLITSTMTASNAKDKEKFEGFSLKGEIINPICIANMQPWLSEKPSTIIVRSIILEDCQKSNWASYSDAIETRTDDKGNKYVFVNRNEEGYFSYQVIGQTKSQKFILFQRDGSGSLDSPTLAAYQLTDETIVPDFKKSNAKRVHKLTLLSVFDAPCFISGSIDGENFIMKSKRHNPEATGAANMCLEGVEEISLTIP